MRGDWCGMSLFRDANCDFLASIYIMLAGQGDIGEDVLIIQWVNGIVCQISI